MNGVLGVAAGEQDRDIGLARPDTIHHLVAAHPGHYNVQKQKVHFPGGPVNLDGLMPVGGCQHRIARPPEGQVDLEDGAFPGFAVGIDHTVMLLYYPVGRCKPDTGSLPRFLGGEEGLEYPLHGGGVHAGAGVGHREQYESSGPCPGVFPAVLGVDENADGLYGENASFGHGVPGVHAQVHYHLLKHSLVALHGSHGAPWNPFQAYVLSNEPPHHPQQVLHQEVEVQHLRGHDLSAAEEQQLPCKVRRSPGAVEYALYTGAGIFAGVKLLQHLGVSQYDLEHVVEVVGDAPGKLAHRLKGAGRPGQPCETV